jgi:NAD(P)H dehydrogenase (quinone)
VILRNGWYSENYTASIPAALAHGVVLGAAGNGRIASAARADYAEAAAAALTGAANPGDVIELAGDEAYTLAEFAAELSRQTGRAIPYTDLTEAEYRAVLEKAGLPAAFTVLLADSDAQAAKGALFDDGRTLSRLIGRPTTPLAETIRAALKA